MSFGDLYTVPQGGGGLPGPPIDLPQVDRPRPRTSLTIAADRASDPWAAAGIKITPAGSKEGGKAAEPSDPWAAAGVPITPPGEYKAPEQEPYREVGAGEAFGREAAHAATFGLTPALAGAISAGQSPEEQAASAEGYRTGQWPSAFSELGSLVKGLMRLGIDPGDEALNAYRKARKEAQGTLEAGREQHPYASMAGGLAGAALTPLPGLGPGTALARIGRGALAGGAGGAAYGAGSALSEGKDVGDIGTEAAIGGTLGGLTGGAFGGVLGPRLPRAPRTPGERAAATAEGLGAPIPRGLASDVGALQSTTASLRSVPFFGARVGHLVDEAQRAAGGRIEDIGGQMGGITDRAAADAIARPGLQTAIDANRATIDANYNAVRNKIDLQRRFLMPQTRKALQDIRQDRAAAGWTNPSAGLEQFENVANGATFNGAHRARVDAREAGNVLVPHPGYNAADYNRLTKAMTADIRAMAAGAAHNQTPAGRAAALRAFDEAERAFGPLAEQNSALRKLIDARGEGAIGTLLNASKEKGGNVKLLAQLKRTMSPHDFQIIGGQLLHELGHNTATGEFSLAKFATQWGKTSKNARDILFQPQHLRDIEDIAGLGTHIKKALRDSNTSHTANAVILFDLAKDFVVMASTGALAHVLSAPALAGAAASTPALAFSHWLSGKATASSMAKWARARVGLLGHPTPARAAAFSIATRNLSHTLGVPAERILDAHKEATNGTQR